MNSQSTNWHFIKATLVKQLLNAKSESATVVSQKLGWNRNRLGQYLNYHMKINDEDLQKVADYFNQHKSALINYHPTKSVIAKYKKAQVNKNRTRKSQSTTSNEKENKMSNDELSNMLLTNVATAVNNLSSDMEKISNAVSDIQSHIQHLEETIVKQNIEQKDTDDKRQTYLISQIKDLKTTIRNSVLDSHFRG